MRCRRSCDGQQGGQDPQRFPWCGDLTKDWAHVSIRAPPRGGGSPLTPTTSYGIGRPPSYTLQVFLVQPAKPHPCGIDHRDPVMPTDSVHITGEALWRRMERAVEKVQERLERTAQALEQASIPYAIVGGNAVRAWVAQADEAAVRTTRDVDILIRRVDFAAARSALEAAGFVYRHTAGIDMFLDGPQAKARDAVHIVFAGERIFPEHPLPAPDVSDSVDMQNHRTVTLEALVRMKLNSFRDRDRMHLRDLIDVELVSRSWCDRYPPELARRLQELLDNPNG